MNSSVFTANCHFVKWEFISWIHLLTAVWWSTVNDVNYVGCVIDLCLALLHSLTNHASSGRSLTVHWPITSRVAFHSQFIDQSWVEWALTHSFSRFLLHICNHKKHLHAQYKPSNKFPYLILISDYVNLSLIAFSYIHGVSDNESPMKSILLLSALPPLGHIWDVMLVWRNGECSTACRPIFIIGSGTTLLSAVSVAYTSTAIHCGSKKTRQLRRTITTTQFSRF